MAVYFRRYVGPSRGLRFLISQSGITPSIGIPGARLSLGRRPALTLGLPGSGLYLREPLGGAPSRGGWFWRVLLAVAIFVVAYAIATILGA